VAKHTDSYLTHPLGLLAYIGLKTNLKESTPQHSVKIPTGVLYSLMILLPDCEISYSHSREVEESSLLGCDAV